MPGIVTDPIEAQASVDGADMRVTDVEVNRTIGTTADQATVKGIVGDVDNLELGQNVSVQINQQPVFHGTLRRATQNEEGIVTMQIYGPLFNFHNKRVRLNVEGSQEAYWVLQDIMFDAGYTPAISYSNAPDDPMPLYIDPQEEMISSGVTIENGYGSGDRGEPLSNVVDDLATKLHAEVWVDRAGVIRIESYPPHRQYNAPYITELDSGEDTTVTERVVVKGGSPVGDLGPAGSHMHSQSSHTAVAERTDEDSSDEDKVEKTIDDQNVVTQEAANTTASSEMYRSVRQSSPGEVTLVGNVDIDLFDAITIPELEDTRPFSDNTYIIKDVQHVVNAQDGFTTRVTLSNEPTNIMEQLTGSAGDLGSLFAARIRNQRIDAGVLQPVVGFTESGVGIAQELFEEIQEQQQ